MKTTKPLFICLFLSFIGNIALMAQSFDMNGNPFVSDNTPGSISKISTKTKSMLASDSIRPLTELNKPDTADAYPFISSDGLRLYFNQGNTLYVASRSDVNSEFTNKQLISSLFSTSQMQGCWLTSNENEVFYSSNYSLYYSTRTSTQSPFSSPQNISLLGNVIGNLYGPSLTEDKQQLFLCNYNNKAYYILKFVKSGTSSYTFADTMKIPTDYMPGPGQLSKDGLKYYVSLKSTTDTEKLCVLKRTSLDLSFTDLTFLDSTINSSDILSNIQPTVTANESLIVWVKNNNNNWSGNDLYIKTLSNIQTSILDVSREKTLNIYPNPASSSITINTDKRVAITIYTSSGEEILYKEINGKEQLPISNLSTGMYVMKITSTNEVKSLLFVKK